MKKGLCLAAAVLIMGGACFAASATQQAVFTVNVASVFELTIDQGNIDFGRMKPGELKWNMPPQGIAITSKTNGGKPWYLKVSSSTPFSFNESIIPYNNFTWSGWSDGAGSWYGQKDTAVTSIPTLVYSSGPGEDNNLPNGTANHFKFKLKVPENQAPGLYTTTVKFTMTE